MDDDDNVPLVCRVGLVGFYHCQSTLATTTAAIWCSISALQVIPRIYMAS